MKTFYLITDRNYPTEKQHSQLIFGELTSIELVYKNCDVVPFEFPQSKTDSELQNKVSELIAKVETLTNQVIELAGR